MDEELSRNLLKQILDFWIRPEIEKRKSLGKLGKDFEIRSAQIIFSMDRGFSKVRLNKEVKAEILAIPNKDIKKGDLVFENDLDRIDKIILTDDDRNCAHVTILKFKDKWIISTDFRYNKARVREHINASKEFYESAKSNLRKKLLRPFFENAFAAAELSAKSILLLLPDMDILHGTSHDDRRKRFRGWADLGNVPTEYSKVLDELTSIRPSSRYLTYTEYKRKDTKRILHTVKEMIDFAEKEVS